MNSTSFSFARLWQLYKVEWQNNKKAVMIFFVAFPAVWLIPLIFQPSSVVDSSIVPKMFPFEPVAICLLYFSVTAIASISFQWFRSKSKTTTYLALPASNAEKFASMWFLTAPAYFLIAVGYLYLIRHTLLETSLFSRYWYDALPAEAFTDFNGTFNAIAWIFFSHAVFMIGAVAFKRLPWLFTVGISIPIQIVIGIFAVMIFKPLFNTTTQLDAAIWNAGMKMNINGDDLGIYSAIAVTVITIILWAVSYLKLTEKQT